MNALLASLGLVTLLPMSPPREVPPCSAETCASNCINDLCTNDLPGVDRVLLSNEAGYCWCQCPELAANQLEDAIRERTIRYSKAYAPPSAIATTTGDDDCGVLRVIGNDATVSDWQPCSLEQELIHTIKEIKEGLSPPLDDFNVQLDSEICGSVWPRNQPRSYQEVNGNWTRQQIYYPLRFLYDQSVHEELRLFILLHEIGHDAWRERQGIDTRTNEFIADEWAARVGLPLVKGPAWTVNYGANFLDSVATQLTNFHNSQYVRGTAHLASASTNGPNNYPELECRLRGIKGYYTVASDGNCGNIHPQECWDEIFTGVSRLDSCAFPKRPCPPPSIISIPGGASLSKLAETVRLNEQLKWDLLDLFEPCRVFPCDCDGQPVLTQRVNAGRYERSRRRTIKHLHIAAERLRRLADIQKHDQHFK